MSKKPHQFSYLKHLQPEPALKAEFRRRLEREVGLLEPASVSESWFRGVATRSMALSFSLLIVVTTTLSALADGALPGDTLYSFKTSREEVRGLFLTSAGARATWQTERLSRRLREAEELARTGLLTIDQSRDLEESIHEHVASAREEVEKLSSTGKNNDEAVEAAVKLDSTLKIYSQVLNGLAETVEPVREIALQVEAESKGSDTVEESAIAANELALKPKEVAGSSTPEIALLKSAVSSEVSAPAGVSERVTDIVTKIVSPEDLKQITDKKLVTLERQLENESSQLQEELRVKVSSLMSDAREGFRLAQGAAAHGDVEAARQHYVKALEAVQDAQTLFSLSATITPESLKFVITDTETSESAVVPDPAPTESIEEVTPVEPVVQTPPQFDLVEEPKPSRLEDISKQSPTHEQ